MVTKVAIILFLFSIMSDYQFVKYQEIRLIERSNESNKCKQKNKEKVNELENVYDI